jgi:hypothetical protein
VWPPEKKNDLIKKKRKYKTKREVLRVVSFFRSVQYYNRNSKEANLQMLLFQSLIKRLESTTEIKRKSFSTSSIPSL